MTRTQILEAKTQTQLDWIVDGALDNDDITNHLSESYAETAERIRGEHPALAELLDLAEKRWFELAQPTTEEVV